MEVRVIIKHNFCRKPSSQLNKDSSPSASMEKESGLLSSLALGPEKINIFDRLHEIIWYERSMNLLEMVAAIDVSECRGC